MDSNGRWRSVTVGFRVSPEESELLNTQVAISGLPKQEYILNRLLDRDVVVIPSVRVQGALQRETLKVYQELRRIRDGSEISPQLEACIELLTNEFIALGADIHEPSDVQTEDDLISKLTR